MINYIRINNGITHHNVQFNFQKGTTAIHGRNGRGKSLIQEFIRFALFGSSALRGKTSDYPKNLEVELCFEVRGVVYCIKRTLNDCYFNGVVGTTACNSAIVKTLGYDLSIFDMGNCAKQFEITKLGKMKPSERKQAVDKLIGLDIIDSIIKELKEENLKLKGYVEGLSKVLEPEKPVLKEVIADLTQEEIDEELKKRNKLKQIEFSISQIDVKEKPNFDEEEPEKPKGSKENSFKKSQIVKSLILPREKPKYDSQYLNEQKERELNWRKFLNETEPSEKSDWVEREIKLWEKYKEWELCLKVDCPKCGNHFSPKGIKKVEKPKSDLNYVLKQRDLINFWKNKPECEKPEISLEEIKVGLDEVSRYEKEVYLYDKMKKELDELLEEEPYSNWVEYDKKYESFSQKKTKYINDLQKYELFVKLNEEKDKLKISEHKLEDLEQSKVNQLYNKAVFENYEKQMKIYKINQSELTKQKVRKSQLDSAIKGLNNIKLRVKSSITPNLSRVASELCYEMTEGEVSEIQINEDFEILVDGKNISLLSGSEEAVANLSIRLALGRILTHKVLNVFIGDEIDSAMDDNRALLVSESLKKLTNQIDQIILISHKKIDADNYIFI